MALILDFQGTEASHKLEIPPEIFSIITDYLPKSDWKSLRLVSRRFSQAASELPFFNELYFNPHAEDLSVFHGVCQHPQWASQVTSLIYVKTLFYPFTLALVCLQSPDSPELSDLQSNAWLATHPGPAEYIKHYQAQGAVDQLPLLTAGLRKLPNVSRLHISSQFLHWPSKEGDIERRSPLSRAWKRDWLAPPSWEPTSPSTTRTILSAIALSGANITELSMLEEVDRAEQDKLWSPAEAFRFESPVLESVEAIFGNLTTLKLKFIVEERQGSGQFIGFGKLLRKAEKIETLVLVFEEPDIDAVEFRVDYAWQQEHRVDLETLFGDTTFPGLQTLELRGMEVSVDSMEGFLRRHMNSLRGLRLEVQFSPSSEDRWADFVAFVNELKEDLVDGLKTVPEIQEIRDNRGLIMGNLFEVER
jgi:hypothetical protein